MTLGARSEHKLEALRDELGGPERPSPCADVTSWDDQQALVARTLEDFGRMDAYFANAGFGAKRGFLEESVEHWKSMIDTNVFGAAPRSGPRLGHFRSQNRGHLASRVRSPAVARPASLYSATKHAVTAMGEALRAEVSETNMKVTLIEPGMVDTPFFDNPVSNALEPDDIARGDVRAHPAAARRSERDPRPADPPGT